MTPSWRKPVGALGICAFITFWVVIVASFSRIVGDWPILVQTMIYLIAGVVWILPLKPVLQWMETGTWRAPVALRHPRPSTACKAGAQDKLRPKAEVGDP